MADDLAPHMRAVAIELCGKPNQALSTATELRFGTHGSLSVDLKKGTFYDHEAKEGGGVLDLIERATGNANGAAAAWMHDKLGIELEASRKRGRPRKDGGRVVAYYVYTDADDAPLFRVVRREPKSFAQQRYDAGRWIGGKGCMEGVKLALYRLPELLRADPSEPVLIVEGEKDCDRLADLGFLATTSPQGAKKWGKVDPAARAALHGRCVVIVPDLDRDAKTGRCFGIEHMEEVARDLAGKAASVRLLKLPIASPTKDRKDVSDWLDAGGTADELRDLIEQAPEAQADAEGQPDRLVLDPADPYASAKLFLVERYADPSGPLLRHHKGDFYRHAGTHWAAVEDAALRAESYAWMAAALCITDKGRSPFKPTARRTNDLLDALKAAAHLGAGAAPPSWLPGAGAALPADELVPMQNGLLHLASGALLPTTPGFFNTCVLPFGYDPCAPEPAAWLDFLASIWPDDPEAQSCLQEVMGYLISGDRRQQKVFLVVGPPRSGKGTIARVIRSLIGAENVAGPTLTDLGGHFGLAPLIGKSVAVIADARLSGRADAAVIAERLLSISGEDAITIDRKHREHWTGILPTRFVLLTNELPKISDASGALASRFVALTMRRSFLGKEDHGLGERLIGELPGILNWTIAGWRRLSERGHFVMPASSAGAMEQVDALSSPIRAFLKAACRIEPGLQVPVDRLYAAWCHWCRAQGRDEPGTAQTFGRDLRAAVPGLEISRPRAEGRQIRCYEGITLRDETR